jgi:hypothetical protein
LQAWRFVVTLRFDLHVRLGTTSGFLSRRWQRERESMFIGTNSWQIVCIILLALSRPHHWDWNFNPNFDRLGFLTETVVGIECRLIKGLHNCI